MCSLVQEMKTLTNTRPDKDFVIVSFYTHGEYYEEVFNQYLFPSLKKFNLPYHIEEIESLGSYQANTGLKSLYVRKMLDVFPTVKVIWTDVDSEFKKYPILFEKIQPEYDMAATYWDMDKWYKTDRYHGRLELHSGTVMFRNTAATKQVVDDWRARIVVDPINTWEQRHLEVAIAKHPNILVFKLPLEYVYVMTLPNGDKPFIKLDPVVAHYQAGRKVNRNQVKV